MGKQFFVLTGNVSGYFLLSILLLTGCKAPEERVEEKSLFSLLDPATTNITFSNQLTRGLNTNILMYEYFYNGGGVAIGDLNGDGLQDIYFSGNMVQNRLYLNKGDMQFEDVTKTARVGGKDGPWKTGVTMADVNGDGLLDIYSCYSGKLSAGKRKNRLYINQGNNNQGIPSFKEQAETFGLADSAYSTHATFFDYDRDGDLDCLVLNHNIKRYQYNNQSDIAEKLQEGGPMMSPHMYENVEGRFKDVSREVNMDNSLLNYGLGVAISDLNRDGWPDIYICNDYLASDFLYMNNGDGTFSNKIKERLEHTSNSSMGNDIADINNDGLTDIYTLDMLPESNSRQKLLKAPSSYDYFEMKVDAGIPNQYMRNMLHINNGNGTYSEVGQMAGISNTDWSWAGLFADYDNDGWKDLYVTNGFLRDFTNLDFLQQMGNFLNSRRQVRRRNLLELSSQIPSSDVANYVFQNQGGLTFEDKTGDWGLDQPANSTGAAYGDLDNDGDLDLVVNNINDSAFIYRNEANALNAHHYLQVKLEGKGQNTFGIGARVTLYSGQQLQMQEQMPSRGYQSSVSPVLHFGLERGTKIDSLKILWPGGKQQVINNIKPDQVVKIHEKKASPNKVKARDPETLYVENQTTAAFKHQDNQVNDFKRQPLMLNPMSYFGPCLIKGDINNDGKQEIFTGGGPGQTSQLFRQNDKGAFNSLPSEVFEGDHQSEDVESVFFDADGDQYIDLYVGSGGYDNFRENDPALQDRLYINDGRGHFQKSADGLPEMLTSTGTVATGDLNGDGHEDLFVGGRVVPGNYPGAPESYILLNNGQGKFEEQTERFNPDLKNPGMVSDAAITDFNGDGTEDLILVGEMMPVKIFINQGGNLEDQSQQFLGKDYSGFWNKMLMEDFNQDGQPDLLLGNLGMNTQIHATPEEPAELFYQDFNNDGEMDPILCFYIQGKSYPYVTRDQLVNKMPRMANRFPDYASYADATLNEIFSQEVLKEAKKLEVNHLETTLLLSNGSGQWEEAELPKRVQSSPVFTMTTLDYNNDGNKDLLLGGNIHHARLRLGNIDANYGQLLKGNGDGTFDYIPQNRSGFKMEGDVRGLVEVDGKVLVGVNGKSVEVYSRNELSVLP